MLKTKIHKITNSIAPPIMNSLTHTLIENIHNIQNFQIPSNNTVRTVRMELKDCHIAHLSHGQIYHKIKNLKLLYMLSKQKQESEMLKLFSFASVSITKETYMSFKCY